MKNRHTWRFGCAALLVVACGGRSLLGEPDEQGRSDGGTSSQASVDAAARAPDASIDSAVHEAGLAAEASVDASLDGAGPWTLALSGNDIKAPAVVIGSAIEVGDVTGDGRDDVVLIADRYNDAGLLSGGLAVFVQSPQGTLSKPIWYDEFSEGLLLGDVGGDGRKDVVLGNSSGAGGISVLEQTAAGTLSAPLRFIADVDGNALRLGDRIAFGRFGGALSIVQTAWPTGFAFWKQTAQAGFSLEGPFALTSYDLLEVGDVTGDGLDDVVVTTFGGAISVVPQTSDGGFGALRQFVFEPSAAFVEGLAVGDLTGDGLADAVVAYGGNKPASHVAVLPQVNGTLGAPIPYECLDNPEDARIADMNGDGRLDLVIGHGGFGAAGVFLQESDGRFAAEQTFPWKGGVGGGGHAIAVGDLNGDGKPDIAGLGESGISLLLSE